MEIRGDAPAPRERVAGPRFPPAGRKLQGGSSRIMNAMPALMTALEQLIAEPAEDVAPQPAEEAVDAQFSSDVAAPEVAAPDVAAADVAAPEVADPDLAAPEVTET